MPRIFISHSRKDTESDRIADALIARKVEIWIDVRNQHPGVNWKDQILEAIRNAEAILFIFSANSAANPRCQEEVKEAIDRKKRIIVVRIDNIDPEKLPPLLQPLHFVDCREEIDNFENAIDQIIKGINKDYEWLRFHTELQNKAEKWKNNNKNDSYLIQKIELQEAEQWLVRAGSSQDPQFTELQKKFISESKRFSVSTQRRNFVLLAAVAAVIVVLGFIGLVFAIVALQRGILANAAQATATVARGRAAENALTAVAAITQKAEQVGTAQAQVEEAAHAVATAHVASGVNESIARKLAAKAASISLDQGPAATLSGLLAVEATKRFPHLEADQALRNYLNVAAVPISSMKFNDYITSADFSPDGKQIAVASFDGSLRVQEIETGREIVKLTTDSDFVRFSPDGKWLATVDCTKREEANIYGVRVCSNYEVRIWDTTNWRQVSHMVQGNYESTPVFSSDSQWLVSGGMDQTVNVWEASSGKVIASVMHGNTFDISSVAFSPDGKLVASASADRNAIVWEATTGREIARFRDVGEVDYVSFSPDSKRVVAGGHDAAPVIWDANTGQIVTKMAYNGSVGNALFSPDGSSIASSDVGVIRIWDASTGQIITSMKTNDSGSVTRFRFSADGKQILSLGSIAQVWDLATGVELKRLVLGESALAFSADAKRVAFANSDGTFYVGEFPRRQEVALMSHDASVEAIAFSPNGKWIVSGSNDGTTRVWDVAAEREISRMTVDGLVVDVDFSSDGDLVAQAACEGVSEGIVACGRAIIRIWEAATGKEVYQLQPDFAITSIKFTPDTKGIIMTGGRGSIQLWNLATGQMVSTFEPDLSGNISAGQAGTYVYNADIDPSGRKLIANGQVWDINSGKELFRLARDAHVGLAIFSPSGKWIASAGSENVRIWDSKDGKELMQLSIEPFTGAGSLAFSHDEKWLVGADGTLIHIWETSTGREVARITTSITTSVDISSDSKWVASGDNDGRVHVGLWRPEDLFAEACFRLPRNLTHEEWNLYVGNEPYQPTCPNLPIPQQ